VPDLDGIEVNVSSFVHPVSSSHEVWHAGAARTGEAG
jgi:hypothetical protein